MQPIRQQRVILKPATVVLVKGWTIKDFNGNPIAVHERVEMSDGSKRYRWRRPDASIGLGGIAPDDLLYGMEDIGESYNSVLIVEGEKARDALAKLQLPMVTVLGTVCGAPHAPSNAALAWLKDRNVFLWPDNDEVGHTQMQLIAQRLQGLATSVKLIAWGEREKDDAADFVERGGTIKEIFALARAAKGATGEVADPNVVNWGQLQVVDVSFLWHPYIPYGKVTLVEGQPGTGKGHPYGTKILTPTGWRSVEELRSGDSVIGSNGFSTRVTAVHERGVLPIYRVTMNDGASVRVDGDHLWLTYDRRRVTPEVSSTTDLAKELRAADGRLAKRIPMASPVEFAGPALPIPPYILGVLLGDRLPNGVTFTPGDYVVPNLVEALLPSDLVMNEIAHDNCPAYKIVSKNHGPNSMLDSLRALGLTGLYSHEKFIPPDYLTGSAEQRLELLRGLMDTDGWLRASGAVFSSSSQKLAEDVAFLVESLGGNARRSQKEITTYTHLGEKRFGLPSYTITMRLPLNMSPTKAWRDRYRPKYPPARFIRSITPDGVAHVVCLTVEAPDSLYLTEHCIVTHNSFAALAISACVTTGRGLPHSPDTLIGHKVLFMSAEDGIEDTLLPRIKPMGANLKNLVSINKAFTFDREGLKLLDDALERYQPALVVFDPLFAFFGGKIDINRANETREMMTSLYDRAMKHGCAILAIRHLTKSGGDALTRGLGSVDITAAARSVLLVGDNPRDTTETERVVVHLKSNLAPKGRSLVYTLDPRTGFRWHHEYSDVTAEELVGRASGPRQNEIEEAIRLVATILSENGPLAPEVLSKRVRDMGMDIKTLWEAETQGRFIYRNGHWNLPPNYSD